MDIVMPRTIPEARLEVRLLTHRTAERLAWAVANRLPRSVRRRVIAGAAGVAHSAPDCDATPDDLTYKQIYEAA